MATIMMIVMIGLLLLGFPMMIPLTTAAVIGFVMMFDGFGQMGTFIQQMMGGIRPASLIAVPMFILAADIMTRGQSADRLCRPAAQDPRRDGDAGRYARGAGPGPRPACRGGECGE